MLKYVWCLVLLILEFVVLRNNSAIVAHSTHCQSCSKVEKNRERQESKQISVLTVE